MAPGLSYHNVELAWSPGCRTNLGGTGTPVSATDVGPITIPSAPINHASGYPSIVHRMVERFMKITTSAR